MPTKSFSACSIGISVSFRDDQGENHSNKTTRRDGSTDVGGKTGGKNNGIA